MGGRWEKGCMGWDWCWEGGWRERGLLAGGEQGVWERSVGMEKGARGRMGFLGGIWVHGGLCRDIAG